MNYKLLKTATLFLSAFLMLIMTGCVKENTASFTDFSQVSDFVALTGGAQGSSSLKIPFNRGADFSQTITVDLASANSSNPAITVTIAVDPGAITAYNSANGTNFVSLPTSNYKLNSTSVAIPAGQHYGSTTLSIMNLSTLDPAVSYMIAISITDGGGKKLSSNLNTLYFYTIGNPLAGVYSWNFYRWNGTSDTTGAPNSTVNLNQIVSVSPAGPTILLFPEGYLNVFVDASPLISLSFTNNSGVLSNFSGFLTSAIQNEITDPAGFGGSIITSTILVGYKIVGDASTKYAGSTFRFYTSLKNSGGGTRTLIDNFIKQ